MTPHLCSRRGAQSSLNPRRPFGDTLCAATRPGSSWSLFSQPPDHGKIMFPPAEGSLCVCCFVQSNLGRCDESTLSPPKGDGNGIEHARCGVDVSDVGAGRRESLREDKRERGVAGVFCVLLITTHSFFSFLRGHTEGTK